MYTGGTIRVRERDSLHLKQTLQIMKVAVYRLGVTSATLSIASFFSNIQPNPRIVYSEANHTEFNVSSSKVGAYRIGAYNYFAFCLPASH